MKKYLLILLFLSFTTIYFSQESDTLLRFDTGNKRVYLGDHKMNMNELFKVMRPYPETFKLIESARDGLFYANIFYTLGSIPVGYTIGYFLPSNEFKWKPFVVGLGLIGIGIPFNVKYVKNTRRAVDSFNNRKNTSLKFQNKLDFSFGINQYGFGVQLKF